MSCRPGAMHQHRRRQGERAALRQWRNQNSQMRPGTISVEHAMLALLHESPAGMSVPALQLWICMLTLDGKVHAPMPTRADMEPLVRTCMLSDDGDDINIAILAQARLRKPMPGWNRLRAPMA